MKTTPSKRSKRSSPLKPSSQIGLGMVLGSCANRARKWGHRSERPLLPAFVGVVSVHSSTAFIGQGEIGVPAHFLAGRETLR